MKIYVCTDFEGFWPAGTAAVMVASSEEEAIQLLLDKLKAIGLSQSKTPNVSRVPQARPTVQILNDGTY